MMPHMEPAELREWIAAHGYTVSGLARDLDVERKTVQRYLSGESVIPRAIELALEALAAKKEAAEEWTLPDRP